MQPQYFLEWVRTSLKTTKNDCPWSWLIRCSERRTSGTPTWGWELIYRYVPSLKTFNEPYIKTFWKKFYKSCKIKTVQCFVFNHFCFSLKVSICDLLYVNVALNFLDLASFSDLDCIYYFFFRLFYFVCTFSLIILGYFESRSGLR